MGIVHIAWRMVVNRARILLGIAERMGVFFMGKHGVVSAVPTGSMAMMSPMGIDRPCG